MSHVKDRLSSYHDWMKDIVNRYKLVTARNFLEMIEQLQEDLEQDEKENSWISVSERLPEDEKEYLVTLEKVYGTPDTFFGIASYLKFGNDGYWNEKKYGYLEWDKYSDGHGGTKMYKVVAWMPQPELYRKEKNNE